MPTTIQLQDKTLEILRKIKLETHAQSYDEAINKLFKGSLKKESMAGFLGKKHLQSILKDVRDKHERL